MIGYTVAVVKGTWVFVVITIWPYSVAENSLALHPRKSKTANSGTTVAIISSSG